MSRLYVGGREMKENRLSRKGDIKVMSNRRADRKISKEGWHVETCSSKRF